jgi:hypothetical protein
MTQPTRVWGIDGSASSSHVSKHKAHPPRLHTTNNDRGEQFLIQLNCSLHGKSAHISGFGVIPKKHQTPHGRKIFICIFRTCGRDAFSRCSSYRKANNKRFYVSLKYSNGTVQPSNTTYTVARAIQTDCSVTSGRVDI